MGYSASIYLKDFINDQWLKEVKRICELRADDFPEGICVRERNDDDIDIFGSELKEFKYVIDLGKFDPIGMKDNSRQICFFGSLNSSLKNCGVIDDYNDDIISLELWLRESCVDLSKGVQLPALPEYEDNPESESFSHDPDKMAEMDEEAFISDFKKYLKGVLLEVDKVEVNIIRGNRTRVIDLKLSEVDYNRVESDSDETYSNILEAFNKAKEKTDAWLILEIIEAVN